MNRRLNASAKRQAPTATTYITREAQTRILARIHSLTSTTYPSLCSKGNKNKLSPPKCRHNVLLYLRPFRDHQSVPAPYQVKYSPWAWTAGKRSAVRYIDSNAVRPPSSTVLPVRSGSPLACCSSCWYPTFCHLVLLEYSWIQEFLSTYATFGH